LLAVAVGFCFFNACGGWGWSGVANFRSRRMQAVGIVLGLVIHRNRYTWGEGTKTWLIRLQSQFPASPW
jgi:hypothetical protein